MPRSAGELCPLAFLRGFLGGLCLALSQSGDLASLALSTRAPSLSMTFTSWELLPHATRPSQAHGCERLPCGLCFCEPVGCHTAPACTGAGREASCGSACDQEAGAGPHTQQKGPGQWCSVEKKCSAAIQKRRGGLIRMCRGNS